MEEIVRQLYTQWMLTKEQARQECESSGQHELAEKYRQCDLFKGTERTVEELVEVFLSPAGLEFCMKYRFPHISALRLFKGYGVDKRFGIYIDAGVITLRNPGRAVLIGRTTATVNCDENSHLHRVVLMHGAKAVVNASQWAVAAVQAQQGCSVIKNVSDKAIIL